MKKIVLVFSLGRAGSTLLTFLLNTQLPKPSISQESDAVYIAQGIDKIVRGDKSGYNEFEYYFTKGIYDALNRGEGKGPAHQYYFYPYKVNGGPNFNSTEFRKKPVKKQIRTIWNAVYDCDQDVVGSKILIEEFIVESGEFKTMIMNILNNYPDIHIVLNTRDVQGLVQSRKNNNWTRGKIPKKLNPDYLQKIIDILKTIEHPRLYHTNYEDFKTQLPIIIRDKLCLDYNEEKFLNGFKTKCYQQ